jgi:SAM-dependent methyltransferase
VNFLVADASRLEGLENRFDTVVDCAFYHVFSDVPEVSRSYAQALHRATRPGARLYMFEFGPGGVNGIGAPRALSEDNFRQVFPDAGWEISYLEPSTYQVNMSIRAFETMLERNPDKAEEIQLAALRFKLIEPTLANGRAHAPVWEMHATRID